MWRTRIMGKNESVFISVIIPNYCHAKYLTQRIECVLNQTYQNFELIILDDCSPDNGESMAVIEKYGNDAHVSHIVYNTENSGSTFKQWSKGINLAKGEYIWIAESDDYCELNLLEELVSQVKKDESCSLVYCLSQQVDSNGKFTAKVIKPFSNKFLKGTDFVRKYMCCENPVYNASSAIFRKNIALNIDKKYMSYKGAGDRLFWIEIAEMGTVAIVNKPMNYFRQHNQKVTPRKTLDGTNLTEDKKTYDYLVSQNYLSSGIRNFLVKGYYLYLIESTQFLSESVRDNLRKIWNDGRKGTAVHRLLGRLFVSVRYHGLNWYL